MTGKLLSGRAPFVKLVSLLIAVSMVAVAVSGCSLSSSSAYPSQNITFLVPFNAGGMFDIQARLLAPYIQKYLPKNTNVVVQNEPAAATKVATLKLFDANPDGYTIAILNVVAMSTLYAQGDLENRNPADLDFLGRVNYAPYILVVGSKGRFKSLEDMKGQKIRFAGTGSAYMQSVLLAQAIGGECVFQSYNGAPDAIMAVQRGDADANLINWDSAVKYLQASEGALTPVVAFADQRLTAFPDLPTSKELGLQIDPGLMGLMASQSVVAAPGKIPANIEKVLREAVTKAINDPAFIADGQKAGYYFGPLSPEDTKNVAVSVAEFVKAHKDLLKSK